MFFKKHKNKPEMKFKIGDLVSIKGHVTFFSGLILDAYAVKEGIQDFVYVIFWQNGLIIEYHERDIKIISRCLKHHEDTN